MLRIINQARSSAYVTLPIKQRIFLNWGSFWATRKMYFLALLHDWNKLEKFHDFTKCLNKWFLAKYVHKCISTSGLTVSYIWSNLTGNSIVSMYKDKGHIHTCIIVTWHVVSCCVVETKRKTPWSQTYQWIYPQICRFIAHLED